MNETKVLGHIISISYHIGVKNNFNIIQEKSVHKKKLKYFIHLFYSNQLVHSFLKHIHIHI